MSEDLNQQQSAPPYETQQAQPELKESEPEEDKDQYETMWRCWQCKTVYQMDQTCNKCQKQLADYPDDDFSDILVNVKIVKPKPEELSEKQADQST